jgi:biopolymer transport protein ExbB/TolQ
LPLISTAASLVVAIIGTFFYNALSANIETVKMLWDIEHGHAAHAKKKTSTQTKSIELEDNDDVFED